MGGMHKHQKYAPIDSIRTLSHPRRAELAKKCKPLQCFGTPAPLEHVRVNPIKCTYTHVCLQVTGFYTISSVLLIRKNVPLKYR